ncbi:plasmid replication protein RepB [Pseudomonas proteolytica]|jgi:hypothetical protein|uniref:plasmid replication protein RepB n=2 Tax=Pseudomonas TaxID=286 RepID=UPI001475FE00|nr:plasmid replication protein RepB [Pseudomonas sp. MF6754]MBJ2242802.1 plasmid replication protein RepB [Pseudomonas sp. MF6768]MBK3456769.1 plasmid replication protein RepB [Pseudomonas sp. MF6754]NMZ41983.1 plasmid replication protein RepB [Pseudomonas proteolytica]
MTMDLSAMRDKFEQGELRAAEAVPVAMANDAWLLMVVRTNGSHDFMTVARSDRQKVYKSLEAVHADAQRVGFAEMKIRFSGGNLKVA